MPKSMTGYARRELNQDWGSLSCEIRSVNHRYLELGFRIPEQLRSFEGAFRDTLRKRLGRGKVEVSVSVKINDERTTGVLVNQELAELLIKQVEQLNKCTTNPAPINTVDILNWPGVLQKKEVDQSELEKQLQQTFTETLDDLIAMREREGQSLKEFIEQRLNAIDSETKKVRENLPELKADQQARLETKLESLKVELDQERLAQELVYMAQKSDVEEELDRLAAHLSEVKRTLKQNEPIGRRLDFLMQELNREANTLSSKSTASSTTQSAVDLKVYIEQMREQVQNIE